MQNALNNYLHMKLRPPIEPYGKNSMMLYNKHLYLVLYRIKDITKPSRVAHMRITNLTLQVSISFVVPGEPLACWH